MVLYQCKQLDCTKAFKKPSLLKIHQNTHLNVKPFKCNTCSKSYFKQQHLNRHLLIHTEIKKFKCKKCGIAFYENFKLKNHQLKCKVEYNCSNCNMVYVRRKNYENHQLKCENIKDTKEKSTLEDYGNEQECNLECFEGNSGIIKTESTKNTVKIKRERIQCKHCNKSFSKKGNLDLHTKTFHLNIRRYRCRCGKEYLHNHNLKSHILKCETI